MNKLTYTNLDLEVYEEILENGLKIYVVPMNNRNRIEATFMTKYGSNQSEFVPLGKKEMIQVPDGVAHFLEHKLFEQEDGSDPFDFFDARGCECNASTNPWKTVYWFAGTDYFDENLNFLLDFVQAPYFTKKNVEKEKSIIAQEIDMYQDDPYRIGFEKSNFNTFINHPLRIRTAGTKESVNSITKDDLYTCYETFYHPSNMALVITGNVEANHVIDLVKQNQKKKKFKKAEEIIVKEYNEPDEVFKEKEVLEMNVTIPKVFINYKWNTKELEGYRRFIPLYLSIFLDLRIGVTALFSEKLKQEKVITDDIYFGTTRADDHLMITIEADTFKIDELINEIDQELRNKKVSETDFERKKKTIMSSCLFMSDNVGRINERIIGDLVKDGKIQNQIFEDYRNLSFENFKKVIEHVVFDYRSIVIIQPKTSK